MFYVYQGQRVSLTQRQDAIAVTFKHARDLSNVPLYLKLQRDLQAGTRSIETVEVDPVGESYALVSIPTNTRSAFAGKTQQIQRQSYVENTLPVISRSDRDRLLAILKATASYQGLSVSDADTKTYQALLKNGLPPSVSAQQIFFGSGLVDANAAVMQVKRSLVRSGAVKPIERLRV